MDPEIIALFERLAELNHDEVRDLLGQLEETLRGLAGQQPSAEVIEVMGSLADAIRATRERDVELSTAETDLAEQAARILAEAGVELPTAETEGEGEGETAEPAETETAAEETPEVVETPETPEVEGEPETVETPEAVAAATEAPTPTPRPTLAAVARRLPPMAQPRPRQDANTPVTLVAAADLPGIPAGSGIPDSRALFDALVSRYETFENAPPSSGADSKIPVATMRVRYPEDRQLDLLSYEENMERIRAVTEPDAIAAAGGICAPVAARYDLANISQSDRPLRDSLAGFQATRGGVRYITPPHLSDTAVAGATGIWTEATDVTPGGSTKAITTVTCGTPTEVLVDAVTTRMRFGNFNARYFPEQYDTYQQLIMSGAARKAERNLLDKIGSGSISTSHGQALGAISDALACIDLAAAAYRNRNRTARELPLRLLLPEWLDDMFRADAARRIPGDSSDQKERLAVADAEIDNWYAKRAINPTRLLEGETASGQDWSTQGVGPLNPWPSQVWMYMFHEGAWLFLDGGRLDLGLYRDSVTNATNNFETFSETFENVAFVGVESLRIKASICASGSVSGTTDVHTSICTTGS